MVQGIRPLISYNEGAGLYKRVSKIVLYSLIIGIIVMIIGTILFLIIPDKLISIFSSNEDTINNGAKALRIISLGFVVSTFPYIISGVFEALSKGLPSLIISIIRYLFIILPALLLSYYLKEMGVWLSFPITEIVAFITSIVLYFMLYIKKVNHEV